MKKLNKKLVSVMVVFENCEYVELAMKDIKQVLLSNITSALLVSGGKNDFSEAQSYRQCESFYLWLPAEHMDQKVTTKWTIGGSDGKTWTYKDLFGRGDIVSVEMKYDNDEVEDYNVLWPLDEEIEYVNPFQTTKCDGDYFLIQVNRPDSTKSIK